MKNHNKTEGITELSIWSKQTFILIKFQITTILHSTTPGTSRRHRKISRFPNFYKNITVISKKQKILSKREYSHVIKKVSYVLHTTRVRGLSITSETNTNFQRFKIKN